MKKVIAKMYCSSKTPKEDGSGTVTLNTVVSGSPENERFFSMTPGGSVNLSILNKEAMDCFENGREYFVEFYEAANSPEMHRWKPEGPFDFGTAIKAMKAGYKVARAGWNGKNMWIAMTIGSNITTSEARSGAVLLRSMETSENIEILPHIDMKAADGSIVIGWLASQTDMLSDDWNIVD